jgi:hypothetical protein
LSTAICWIYNLLLSPPLSLIPLNIILINLFFILQVWKIQLKESIYFCTWPLHLACCLQRRKAHNHVDWPFEIINRFTLPLSQVTSCFLLKRKTPSHLSSPWGCDYFIKKTEKIRIIYPVNFRYAHRFYVTPRTTVLRSKGKPRIVQLLFNFTCSIIFIEILPFSFYSQSTFPLH